MQHSLKESVKVYILRNKNRKWLHRLVRVLSCLVVFCTTYALILPAITMEEEVFCGLEEHSHTADCYQQTVEQKLICTTGSLALHVHSTGCYDAENKLICGQADYVIHTHDHSCLDSNGMLVCTLPERSAHVHGDSCYAPPEEIPHVHAEDCQARQRGDLICTKEEYDGHTHTDRCYIRSGELECTLTEHHVHNDDCYVYPLNCTQSTEPHVHDSSCHTTGDLLCNTPAGHIHGDSCVEKVHNCQNTEEDHVCGDECYTQVSVCDIPQNHQHEAGCYADVLICGKEEGQAHTHDDACYSTEPRLNCELVENHTHTDACYKKVLNCGLDEDPGYSHTDECYNWETIYTCGYEEGEMETLEPELICTEPVAATHVHGEGCFEEIRSEATPVCGNTDEGHVHNDDCYTIACGLEVHTHEKACYSNPDADVESREVWEATFAHVELTGNPYHDVVAIAETQLGYTESSRNYAVWEDDSVHGYTRYGDWYGVPYGDWCGMFVSFCLRYAGVDDIPVNYGVRPWIEDLSKLGLYHRAEEYTPKSGDIIFYDWEGDNLSDHVGIVAKIIEGTETEPARVKAIEGNSSNCVRYVTYDMDDPQILGYSELPEKEEEEISYYCGMEEHTHGDGCYDAEGNLTCQIMEHTHIEECTVVPVYYCGKEEHTHAEECYDAEGNVTCGREEHTHTEDCLTEPPVYYCGLEEHTHAEECYDAEGNLICTLTEHTHTEMCLEVVHERVSKVIAMIDALPLSEEVEKTLASYENADDWNGYEHYFKEIAYQAQCAYVQYEDLSENEKSSVTNISKLMDLEWLWSARTLEITEGVAVYQINSYNDSAYTTLYYNNSADGYGEDMGFGYWSAIIVDKSEDGTLYVSEIDTSANVDKSAYAPSTDGGFVLLIHDTVIAPINLDVEVGSLVSVDFDYTTTATYTGSSYGTITFATGKFKNDKDNTGKLNIVPSADTLDLIEVNLYDYQDNINVPYNGNKNYPGFQQDFGSINVGSSFGLYSSFNFGNNITSNLSAGIPDLTNKGGNINTTVNSANSPISDAIMKTLKNGYPALSDGTPLEYLFHGASGYATKMNSDNINGLFIHNPVTGAYTFNSRDNHAQFNPGSNTFTLYEQIITSNFMMYPFGNFLPFNDITKLSAQASTIDRDYLLEIADSALYKQNGGYSNFSYVHDNYIKLLDNEYGTLSTQLRQFVSLMDAAYGTDWDAYDAVNQYFATANIPATFTESSPTISPGKPLMSYLYSIDYDEPTNFFFGMDMKMNFMQPKDGLTGNDGKQPMVFYFTGDDDVWVYLDGALFLDLSGIHRHVGGKIDFVNGLISYEDLDVGTGDVSGTVKTVTFEQAFREAYADDSEKLAEALATLNEKGTFKDYSTHSFNFYYMERGAGSGVCRMNFNFPLLKKNTISVQKKLTVDDPDKIELLGNPDFRFQILKADDGGNKTGELFIGAGVEYTIYDSTTNAKLGIGVTDANGVFTLKDGQRAEFAGINENSGKYYVRELLNPEDFQQYGIISVDGSETTVNYYITVGSDRFTGLESNIKDVSDGATVFTFDNQLTFNKLGSLSIQKTVDAPIMQPSQDTIYKMNVILDGVKLPVGTSYKWSDGTEMTVTEAGIVEVKADLTATISNIISGTKFEVSETTGSAEGYIVSYAQENGDEANVSNTGVTGTVRVNTAVKVTVTNAENAVNVQIPVSKTLSNGAKAPDTSHTYKFLLTQMADANGTPMETPYTDTLEISVIGSAAAESQFDLSYISSQFDAATQFPVTCYYQITEVTEGLTNVIPDESVWLAEVEIKQLDNGKISASLVRLTKGEEIETVATFTNTLTEDLAITKIVEGSAAAQTGTPFQFTVTLTDADGIPLANQSFAAAFKNKDGTPAETTVTTKEDGSFTLTEFYHDETVVIRGLPLGTKWTVTEDNPDNVLDHYLVSWTITKPVEATGEGNSSRGEILPGGSEVTFTNTSTYALPETGGIGTTPYTMAGLLLFLSALCLLYIHTKRERGVK